MGFHSLAKQGRRFGMAKLGNWLYSEAMDVRQEAFTAAMGTQILTRGTRVVERPGWYQVLSPGTISASRNEVIHSVVSADRAENVVDETIREYQELGTPFKWCTSPFTEPSGFSALLEKKGFGSWHTRSMYAVPSEFGLLLPLSHECAIERVTLTNLPEYVEAFLRGWILDREPTPTERANLTEDMHWLFRNKPDSARFFLARYEGTPAGTAGYFLKPQSAYLVGGNVLKQFRGKGIYRALLAERMRELREAHIELAVTGARERTSAPILEKLGFETAYRDRVFQLGGTLPE